MIFEETAGLFSVISPLKRVYDYVKKVRETREVERQLANVLQSLVRFAEIAEQAKKKGNTDGSVLR
jgi:hypothetical protein